MTASSAASSRTVRSEVGAEVWWCIPDDTAPNMPTPARDGTASCGRRGQIPGDRLPRVTLVIGLARRASAAPHRVPYGPSVDAQLASPTPRRDAELYALICTAYGVSGNLITW